MGDITDRVMPSSGWLKYQPPNPPTIQQQRTDLADEIKELKMKRDGCMMPTQAFEEFKEYFKFQAELDKKNHELTQNIQTDLQKLEGSYGELHENYRELHESHRKLGESHRELGEKVQDLEKTMSLILPRDFMKRLVDWDHRLVEVAEGHSVLIAIGKRKDRDLNLLKDAKDGDYEAHGGGSIPDKINYIQKHPQWTQRMLPSLDSDDQTCVGVKFQKSLCFISLTDYMCKSFYAIPV